MLRLRPDDRNTRGFIVVAVLWILAALSALVLIYLTFVTNTAVVVAASTERVRSDALVTAGVELATYQLTAVGENARPSSGRFTARMGAARVSVTFRSEAARIDLNAAPPVAIMMVGLQGSGKTTTTAKLARRLTQRDKRKVLMASLDIYRPAAMEQLAVLGRDLDIQTLPIVAGQKPAQIARRALEAAKLGGYDVVLLDTA